MSPPNKELWAAASQELSLRIMDLVRESPFWGHVLGGIRRRLSMTVPTAGVAWTPDGIELLVNPQYFLHGLKGPPQRRGLIRHEALHIIFLHPVRCFRPGDHPILTNIAADLVVNHCIPAQELWDGALRSYDFPDSLVVAVDTSGSISETLMHAFFAEIHRLWREQVDVTVVECDFRVTASYPYMGKVPASVQGRRGTSFEPVFQWMRGKSYDGCIYLTDGEGSAPQTRPACPLLWVVTQKEQMGEHLRWGRAIHLLVEG